MSLNTQTLPSPTCWHCCQVNPPKAHPWSCVTWASYYPSPKGIWTQVDFQTISSILRTILLQGWGKGQLMFCDLNHFFSWYIPLFSPFKLGPYVHHLGRGMWLGKSRTSLQMFLTFMSKSPSPQTERWLSHVEHVTQPELPKRVFPETRKRPQQAEERKGWLPDSEAELLGRGQDSNKGRAWWWVSAVSSLTRIPMQKRIGGL